MPDNASHRSPDPFSAAAIVATLWKYVLDVTSSVKAAARRWHQDDASSLAAAVAYYLALSVFPVLLLLISGVGLFLRFTDLGQDAQSQFLTIVAKHCSPSLETQVEQLLVQFGDQSMISGPFGLVAAILAAVGVFYQFERAFDKIWRIPPPAKQGIGSAILRILTQRLVAFLMLTGVGLTLVTILLANLAIGVLRTWMANLQLPGTVLIAIVDASATMLLNCIAFAVLYRTLPKRKVLWKDAFRSGLLVAIVWEVGREFLCSALINMHSATTYGAIGSFIGMLLWFYWGVTILLFGAEYLQVLTRKSARPYTMFTPKASPGAIVPRRADYQD